MTGAVEAISNTMTWPYAFVSLSAEQLQARRELLDRYGFYAYISPIVLLSSIYAFRKIRKFLPSASHSQKPAQKASTLQLQLRRLSWWLEDPLTPEFGERKVHLLGLVYLSWLIFLSVHKTGNDYLHLTKRIGHIAVSQLPLQYTLAIKTPRSPVEFATGLSWESLNPYHRLFGRIVHLLVAAHAILYMNFFVAANLLSKRIKDSDVQLGLAAFWTFNILAISAIPPLRKKGYHKLFYRPHIATAFILLPLLAFHVPYTRKYIYQALAAYMFNGILRTAYTTDPPILSHILPIDGTNLFRLCSPGPAWGVPPLMGKGTPGWVPGQHVYVKKSVSPKEPRNPFTIASLPPRETQDGGFESSYIDLVIRDLGGPMTGWLAKKPIEERRKDRNVKVLIEGPYGQARHFVPDLLKAARRGERGTVLFVAGGVGATYTLPIYLSLLAVMNMASEQETLNKGEKPTSKSQSQSHTQSPSPLRTKFIWLVKSVDETKWAIDMLRRAQLPRLPDTDIDIQIYVTRSPSPSAKSNEKKEEQNPIDTPLHSPSPSSVSPASPIRGLKTHTPSSRPDIKDIITPFFAPPPPPGEKAMKGDVRGNWDGNEPVTVLSCGPAGLTKQLRKEVGRYVMEEGRDVRWHVEEFGHGGS